MRFKNPQTPARRGRPWHRAGRPAPAGPGQRRPGAVPGDRRAAARVGRRRPRLRRAAHHRLRGVRRAPAGRSTGTEVARVDRADPRADRGGGRDVRDSSRTVTCWAMGITQHRNAVATVKEIVNVALPPGQHRQAGRRAVPGPRPLQRPGRPHHGHLGAAAGALPRRAARRVRLRAAARARPRHRGGGQGAAATAGPRSSSRWAATSSPPCPTPTSPSRRCATPTSPCTSRPSSTARTSSTAGTR